MTLPTAPHNAPMKARWKPHVTVAAIIEREGRYLLIEEQTRDGLRWNNPAGHLDPGETPAQGCAREALEECGHAFEPTALVGVYLTRGAQDGQDVTYLRFAFSGTLGPREADRALDHGIVRTMWLTPAEIEASRERHRSPLVWRCIQDHLAGRRYPLDLVFADPSLFAAGA